MIRYIKIRTTYFDKQGFEESSCYYDDSKYEVYNRIWCNKSGEMLREWTPNEYLTLNPNDDAKIQEPHADIELLVNVHCVERRSYPVIKDGKLYTVISRMFDYKKQLLFDEIPKDNRCWVENSEYDGWTYGMLEREWCSD